jgi:hypothetical protein
VKFRTSSLHSPWNSSPAVAGSVPYPPDYAKMPGEPMRVQPSRAKKPAEQ